MALVDTADLISVTEANKMGVSGLIKEAEDGHEHVVLRNNKPVAAVVSIDHLEELQEIEDDLIDASLAVARLIATGPERHSLDQVLERFGYSREELSGRTTNKLDAA